MFGLEKIGEIKKVLIDTPIGMLVSTAEFASNAVKYIMANNTEQSPSADPFTRLHHAMPDRPNLMVVEANGDLRKPQMPDKHNVGPLATSGAMARHD